MIIKCENAEIMPLIMFDRGLNIDCKNIDMYSLYMDNDLEELLKNIPLDELEKHIKGRKEDE